MSAPAPPPGAIALVGMAGRFPGAADVRALWRNLLDEVEGIRRLDEEALARAGVPEALRRARGFVPAAAGLEGIERFDAGFFGLAPREAAVLDPQQKLLCELAWEACEDAGVVPRRFAGAVGVFVGASRSDWTMRVLADPSHAAALGAFALDLATSRDFLATRLAWVLGCEGPCLTVQSACSTSLVAVHLACQSLLARECDLALAGGVSVRLPQDRGYLFVEGGVASPDGRCRAFDARASGTVPANGGALVCLKRLEDALADGDPIACVLRGTAVNNDGLAKQGFTAPSVAGQRAVIEEALAVAGVEPDAIGYVEAHGTATPLGDPIEVAALRQAFAGASGPCGLGSLKSSLGHLDAAAGVAGLVKAALCVAHGRIPASLHFERANPALELDASPFRVVARTRAWFGPLPRRAGVSSFGIGGTNAHAIVEEPPARAPAERAARELLVLSAHRPEALAEGARRLAARLAEEDAPPLAEAAWTLQSGRAAMRWRAAFVARDAREAGARLAALAPDAARDAQAGERPAAFLVPGQGVLAPAAVRALLAADAALRAEWAALSEEVRARGIDLDALVASERAAEDTALAQPLLCALALALARRLERLGVLPAALVGHSLGELACAALAGVFTPADALALAAERGRRMAAAPAGAMLSVGLSAEALAPLLTPGGEAGGVDAPARVAARIAPEVTVAAGGERAIAALEAELARRRVAHRRLAVRHAFHTPAMDEAAARFAEAVARVERWPPRVPWVSSATGDWIDAARACDPACWGASLREPVRLREACERLAARAELVALELGPPGTFGAALRGLGEPPVALLGRAGDDEEAGLLPALGEAWTRGVRLEWRALDRRAKRRVSLPPVAFQRERSWIAMPEDGALGEPGAAGVVDAGARAPARSPEASSAAPLEGAAARAPLAAGALREGLAELWRALLGVRPARDEDDFLALGGSSLAAIQLALWIEERLGPRVAAARLAAAPRFADQLALLAAARGNDGDAEALVALVALAAPAPGAEREPPLVLVHGIDGEVLGFAPLARALGARRAVHALRSPALAGGTLPGSVEELAAHAARLVRARLGDAAVQVAGHSFGALVALELARALAADGRLVAPLVLVDADLREDGDPPADEDALRAEARSRSAADPERLAELLVAHARAAGRYRPRPWDGAARLVLAEDGAGRERARVLGRWRRALPRCEERSVPGDHLSCLARARELAATISPGVPSRQP